MLLSYRLEYIQVIVRPYIVILILCSALKTAAQTHELKFKLFTGANGISVGKITGMTRDKYGAMWFTDQTYRCITKYDGNLITRYQSDPRNANSPAGTYPECILADSAGFIWIGYFGTGLDRFDPRTNTFTHFRSTPGDPQSLVGDTISNLLIDHRGKLWIGTLSGLSMMDDATGKFINYKSNPADTLSLSYDVVRSLYEDSDGNLWIGTGIPWEPNNYGGLNRFNRSHGNFTRYVTDPNDPNSLLDNKVRAIFEDSRGTLWVGTTRNGLHTIDKVTGSIKRVSVNPDNPNALFHAPIKTRFDHFTFINEDISGFLWFGTLSDGLIRYDPATGQSNHITGKSGVGTSGFKDFSSWWFHSSPDGLMWVSTQEGNLYRIETVTNAIPSDSLGVIVIEMAEEPSGVIAVATPDGFVRHDPNNGSTKRYVNDPQDPNSISNNVVISVLTASDGKLWLGTQFGINKFDPLTEQFTRYLHDPNNPDSPSGNDILETFEDKDGNIWIGSYGGGLMRIDKRTNKFTYFRHKASDSTSISSDYVGSIIQGQDNSIWTGSQRAGINKLNTNTGQFRHYLKEMSVRCLYRDGEQIWVGTDLGLFLYSEKDDKFMSMEEINESLRHDAVTAISKDNQGNMWFVTSTTVFMMNAKTHNIIRLGNENGIRNDLILGSSLKLQNGNMLFGAVFGYYKVNPENLWVPQDIPNIQLTNIMVNGELLRVGSQSLPVALDSADELNLGYNQNFFSIELDVSDFSEAADKIVSYKLEGYDKDWRPAPSENQIYYFNVKPGKYKFIAKAANGKNGVWVEKSIAITITPPWWSTIWAYLAYAGLFGVSVYSLNRIQKERLFKLEREKAHERELEHAREIEKAYSSLKATQTQLIHSEKMASLGELTAGIAHEIQNPLNFVNNFSEVNKELLIEMKDEVEKGNLAEVKSIADSIIENEAKIIHHGKRADAIVKGMLQHSQSSSATKEPTDLNALTDEYLRLAYHGWRAKDKSFNVAIKTDFDQTIGSVNVVPQDIGRVILNLISNAFYVVAEKKRQQGNARPDDSVGRGFEPTVTISTKRKDNLVIVSVKDNGNGVPAEIKDKIFQPFFTTKPTGQGTGLGLSLSYDIVKAHGGELKVDTKQGQGSEFSICLPGIQMN